MSNSTEKNIPDIRVTIHNTYDDPEKKLRASASARIGEAFAVHGLKVWDSEKGPFVSMPSVKVNGEYTDTFHPITKEAREALNTAVLEAYEARLEADQTQIAPQQGPTM